LLVDEDRMMSDSFAQCQEDVQLLDTCVAVTLVFVYNIGSKSKD